MRPRRLVPQVALILALAACAATLAQAQRQEAPTYSRMRQGADDWQARGGGFGYSVPSYMYGGFFPTFGPPVVVTGSWYQRPYPGHFDFARTRWGGTPPAGYYQNQQQMMPRSDCPCANEPTPAP